MVLTSLVLVSESNKIKPSLVSSMKTPTNRVPTKNSLTNSLVGGISDFPSSFAFASTTSLASLIGLQSTKGWVRSLPASCRARASWALAEESLAAGAGAAGTSTGADAQPQRAITTDSPQAFLITI